MLTRDLNLRWNLQRWTVYMHCSKHIIISSLKTSQIHLGNRSASPYSSIYISNELKILKFYIHKWVVKFMTRQDHTHSIIIQSQTERSLLISLTADCSDLHKFSDLRLEEELTSKCFQKPTESYSMNPYSN